MKKILVIIILTFLWIKCVHASEKKFLLCKDKSVIPEKMATTDFKNSFFPEDGGTLTIKYNEKIIKLPFQYGYEDQYLYQSLFEVSQMFPKSNWFKNHLNKWTLKRKYNIEVRNEIKRDCKKRELNHRY